MASGRVCSRDLVERLDLPGWHGRYQSRVSRATRWLYHTGATPVCLVTLARGGIFTQEVARRVGALAGRLDRGAPQKPLWCSSYGHIGGDVSCVHRRRQVYDLVSVHTPCRRHRKATKASTTPKEIPSLQICKVCNKGYQKGKTTESV